MTDTVNPAGDTRVLTSDLHRRPDRDERISIPLEPETALAALLRVDPQAPPPEDADDSR